MKVSEETKRKMSLAKTKNRKCSVDGCNNKHNAHGFCKSHWGKFRRKNDPEYRDRINKRQLQSYYDNHESRKQRKRERGKLERAILYKKLGGECDSCGEKFNPNLKRSNLEFHHKFYDKDDQRLKSKFGGVGSKHILEIKHMVENGINPKKKFGLLCQQCNLLEAWVRMNPSKAFETFCWLHGEGYFDEALKDDPKLKKLTSFMKN